MPCFRSASSYRAHSPRISCPSHGSPGLGALLCAPQSPWGRFGVIPAAPWRRFGGAFSSPIRPASFITCAQFSTSHPRLKTRPSNHFFPRPFNPDRPSSPKPAAPFRNCRTNPPTPIKPTKNLAGASKPPVFTSNRSIVLTKRTQTPLPIANRKFQIANLPRQTRNNHRPFQPVSGYDTAMRTTVKGSLR